MLIKVTPHSFSSLATLISQATFYKRPLQPFDQQQVDRMQWKHSDARAATNISAWSLSTLREPSPTSIYKIIERSLYSNRN